MSDGSEVMAAAVKNIDQCGNLASTGTGMCATLTRNKKDVTHFQVSLRDRGFRAKTFSFRVKTTGTYGRY